MTQGFTIGDRTPDELRPDILNAVLAHVPFDGWSRAAMDRAADDLRIPRGIVDLAFPGGPVEMIAAFSARADDDMMAAIAEHDFSALKIREKVALAVRLRIQANGAYREAARRALTFLALPQNTAAGARMVWRTADCIWRAIGDHSTDFNYYTKRSILAGVFSATMLYWLNDESEDWAATWEFLERRINDVMTFEKVKARALKLGDIPASLVRGLGRLRYGA